MIRPLVKKPRAAGIKKHRFWYDRPLVDQMRYDRNKKTQNSVLWYEAHPEAQK